MNAHTMAQRAYSLDSAPIRTDRGTEYEVFARITHRMKVAAQNCPGEFAKLASAIHDNRQLWALLASDVADTDNKLPNELRARIFYLAEFTNSYSSKILTQKASVEPLLEINTAIMRGLRNGGGTV